jgi:hypothetical protein
MSLKVQVHGGRCCGIKTIHGFYSGPNGKLGYKKPQKYNSDTDCYGHSVGKGYNWYRPSRPKETYLERFEEYICYIKLKRPQGLIEITMTDGQLDGYQYWNNNIDKHNHAWAPVLEKHGFKEVTSFKNSNTGNTVHVFHLVYG